MPIQFDKFDQPKVDNLKSHLELMATKGKPKFYEIFVDALKAVPKTDEPEEFENYEKYMTPDTGQLKIVIYNSGASPRNDQYVFLFKAQNREEAMEIGLTGMPVKTFSYNDISEWREKNAKKSAEQLEIKRLKGEISELKRLLENKEDEIEDLGEELHKARKTANKGSIEIGEVLGSMAQSLLKANTKAISNIPVIGQPLAGFLGSGENETEDQTGNNVEVSFKKKAEAPSSLSEDDQHLLKFGQELRRQFNQEEFGQVVVILDKFSKDKSEITAVLDYLNEEPGQEEDPA